jgi:hypothetical protein
LAPLTPLATSLLTGAAQESELAVVIADSSGRPLWIEAASHVADALAADGATLGRPWRALSDVVEHRTPSHGPSFSAAPVRDPRSGEMAGVLAVAGGPAARGGFVLAALRGAAAVLESHLATRATATHDASPVGSSSALALLRLTGAEAPALDTPYGTTPLGLRHAELLAVLAAAPSGLTTEQLTKRVFSERISAVTLRAEIARLRRVLETSGALEAGVTLSSRPYKLFGVETDESRVGALLDRGALARALAEYGGELLPASASPEIGTRRRQLSEAVRGATLASASLSALLSWLRLPEASADIEAWELAAALVSTSSPHHARIEAHLRALGS